MTLEGKTAFITGSSRGIGREIALKLASLGVNIVVTGKTAEPHPKLEGTIHTVAEEIEALGVKALPLQLDVRDEEAILAAMQKTASELGGIDILVNNASAINLTNTEQTPPKRFDLMFSVNVRATYMASAACLPFLKKSSHPRILTMSPPLNMSPQWFAKHVAYTMSKYGMSMCTLGMAEEFKPHNIAVNSLWPKTTIATAAIANLFPEPFLKASRKPEIVAEAAATILQKPSDVTGQFFIDEDVLRESGETDFDKYALDPSVELAKDLFLE